MTNPRCDKTLTPRSSFAFSTDSYRAMSDRLRCDCRCAATMASTRPGGPFNLPGRWRVVQHGALQAVHRDSTREVQQNQPANHPEPPQAQGTEASHAGLTNPTGTCAPCSRRSGTGCARPQAPSAPLRGKPRSGAGGGSHLRQRLLQIGHQIVDVLDANGQANHVGTHASFFHLVGVELAVGGGGGVAGE